MAAIRILRLEDDSLNCADSLVVSDESNEGVDIQIKNKKGFVLIRIKMKDAFILGNFLRAIYKNDRG